MGNINYALKGLYLLLKRYIPSLIHCGFFVLIIMLVILAMFDLAGFPLGFFISFYVGGEHQSVIDQSVLELIKYISYGVLFIILSILVVILSILASELTINFYRKLIRIGMAGIKLKK